MNSGEDYLISIIIPAYNACNFIIETLNSVRQQTYSNFECLVIDDGSTDSTASLVKEWIQQDKRFAYFYQPNKGLSGARNTGLNFAKGDLIQFLDSDDVILSTKLERQVHFHFKNFNENDLVISYTDYKTGLSGNIYQFSTYYLTPKFYTTDYISEIISRWESYLSIPPNCFLFSSNIFNEYRIRFDEDIPNHEDFDCWLRILHLRPQVKYLDEKLCIYRVTEGSMSKKMKSMSEGFLQALNKHINNVNDSKIKKLLLKKRLKVKAQYRRFDLMNFKEKVLSWKTFLKYYRQRLSAIMN